MEIIAKECPKCGAPLEFRATDKDVHCEHCRMDFAVEFSGDKKEHSPEDYVLSPAHKMINSVAKIMLITIGLFSVFMIGFTAFLMIKMQTSFKDNAQSIEEQYDTNF